MAQRRGEETTRPCTAAINALKQKSLSYGAATDQVTSRSDESSKQQASNDMKFGWFTLPGAVPDSDSDPVNQSGKADAAYQQNCSSLTDHPNDPRSNLLSRSGTNRPPSHSGTFPTVPQSRSGFRPQTQQGQQPQPDPWAQEGSERLVVSHQMGDVSQGPVAANEGNPNPDESDGMKCDDRHIVDWPIASVAVEYIMKTQRLGGKENQTRPETRGCDVPQTPMPPLMWGGYRVSTRPTYATWHRSKNCQHPGMSHISNNINETEPINAKSNLVAPSRVTSDKKIKSGKSASNLRSVCKL